MAIKTYSARDLRSGQFLADSDCSIITSHGKPVKVVIPFDERMFEEGVAKSLALNMVENHLVTQAKGAKMADMPLSDFLELMAKFNIPAAEQTRQEVMDEVEQFI